MDASASLPHRGRWLGKPFALFPSGANLMPDYTYFAPLPPSDSPPLSSSSLICIELKLKCGFLPESPCAGPVDSPKRSISRYQLHQRLKESQGKIRGGCSAYDPVQLFAAVQRNDRSALRAQLQHMIDVPQNNLAVFFEQARVYGGEMDASRAAEDRAASLQSTLQRAGVDGGDLRALVDLLTDVLLEPEHAALLQRILEVQLLDAFDVEGAAATFAPSLIASRADMAGGGPELRLTPPPRSIPELGERLARIRRELELAGPHSPASALTHMAQLPLSDSLDVLRGFVLAMAAKDCSLMIALQRLPAEAPQQGQAEGNAGVRLCGWRRRICVADLEAKNVHKMEHWLQLDREIVRSWHCSRGH